MSGGNKSMTSRAPHGARERGSVTVYLLQCVTAYAAVLALMRKEADYETAYALATLKRMLEPHVKFFCEEEMKLVHEYAEQDGSGGLKLTEDGGFVFRDKALAPEYARRRAELGEVEVREKFPRFTLPRPKSILPSHLEALDEFVGFEDRGGSGGEEDSGGAAADGGAA